MLDQSAFTTGVFNCLLVSAENQLSQHCFWQSYRRSCCRSPNFSLTISIFTAMWKAHETALIIDNKKYMGFPCQINSQEIVDRSSHCAYKTFFWDEGTSKIAGVVVLVQSGGFLPLLPLYPHYIQACYHCSTTYNTRQLTVQAIYTSLLNHSTKSVPQRHFESSQYSKGTTMFI